MLGLLGRGKKKRGYGKTGVPMGISKMFLGKGSKKKKALQMLSGGGSMKMSKARFLGMIKSSNPMIMIPLNLACKTARNMKSMLVKVVGQNDINPLTAVKCIIREAVGAKPSCDMLRIWRKRGSRPSFVTDELLTEIDNGVGVVQQAVQKLMQYVEITPDELASIVCDTCKLCG